MVHLNIPLPTQKEAYRYTVVSNKNGGVSISILADVVENGVLTGEKKRYKDNVNSHRFKVISIPYGYTVEYNGSPWHYNQIVNGTRSCSCPLVRLKGTYFSPRDAVIAGILALNVEDVMDFIAFDDLPAQPVENEYNTNICNARYVL